MEVLYVPGAMGKIKKVSHGHQLNAACNVAYIECFTTGKGLEIAQSIIFMYR